MKHYKIVYTYFSHGLMEEQEMMFRGLSMTDALACVRQMAYFCCMEDFCVRKVYIKTDDGTAWEEVQDWVDIEYQSQRRLAEKAEGDD